MLLLLSAVVGAAGASGAAFGVREGQQLSLAESAGWSFPSDR